MPRLRVLVCNNPADESVAEAFGQLKAKHPDVVFEHVIIGRDREEAKAIFRQLDHSESQQRAVLMSFGWMHGLRPIDLDLLGPVAGSHLKMITSGGAGFDHIDIEQLNKHEIKYCTTPNAVATPTAEFACTMILQLLRQSRACDAVVRSGRWGRGTGKVSDRDGLQPSRSPRNCTLGILGFGTIGKLVAARMQAFGMRCVYFQRRRLSFDEESLHNVEYAESLEKLLQQSDVFTLHLPLSPATHHLIGQEQLAMMKAGSYIVNTARGPIIDETALIDSLKQGHIAGAGLDCFDGEPQVNPGLLNMDNVILAPHHGATVEEVAHEIDMEELAIVDAYLSTGTPLNVVN